MTDELSKTKPPRAPLQRALKASGDLTVGKKVSLQASEKEETPLPQVGTEFKIGNFTYRVTYVNEGKGRFTATPIE